MIFQWEVENKDLNFKITVTFHSIIQIPLKNNRFQRNKEEINEHFSSYLQQAKDFVYG